MEPDCKADEVEPCIGYLEMKEQRDELIEALREYGHHKARCNLTPCDCGILAILAKMDTGTEPRHPPDR